MKIKLAEALLRRKELQQRVANIEPIKRAQLFETITKRLKISEDIDEYTSEVPKLSLAEVTKEHDFYAKRLRLVDALIQQANWTTELDSVSSDVDLFEDFPIEEK